MLQLIKDSNGQNTGVFIPMKDWNTITQKHKDLQELVAFEPTSQKTMADFWGILSDDTAKDLHKQVKQSRKEWEKRLRKQS